MRPLSARRIVVLPAPLAPSSAVTPPSSTSKSTPCSARAEPYHASSPLTSRIGALIRAPEIGAHHVAIGPDLVGRAVGDHAAKVERDDLVGDPHDKVHVMLDEQHRDAAAVADGADFLAQPVDFRVIEPAGRFVEQQQLRAYGERPGELHPLADAERQFARRTVGDGVEAELLDQRVAALGDRRSSRFARGMASALARKPPRASA